MLLGGLLTAASALVGCSTPTARLPEAPPVLAASTSISGVVFADRNANGILDNHEGPRSKLKVYAVAPYGGAVAETETDKNGQFELTKLPPQIESYRVEVAVKWPAAEGSSGANSTLQRWGRGANTGTAVAIAIPPIHRCSGDKLDQFAESTKAFEAPASSGNADMGEGTSSMSVSKPGSCARFLLPDLSPQLSAPDKAAELEYPGVDKWYLDTTTKPGRVLLRIGTYAANLGDGPLHVLGLSPKATTQPVVQRVYGPNGDFVDRPSGTFSYHASHKHIHLGRFEEYTLRGRSDDKAVAGGEKVSFCLTNVTTFADPYPEFKKPNGLPGPMRLRLPLATMDCGAKEQGINSGWSDYYGPRLPEQWIDVTGVPAGEYWIEIAVDPDNVLLESDETNNTARLAIELPPSPNQ
jgi:Lysyl oxidase/SdrD B-like domain